MEESCSQAVHRLEPCAGPALTVPVRLGFQSASTSSANLFICRPANEKGATKTPMYFQNECEQGEVFHSPNTSIGFQGGADRIQISSDEAIAPTVRVRVQTILHVGTKLRLHTWPPLGRPPDVAPDSAKRTCTLILIQPVTTSHHRSGFCASAPFKTETDSVVPIGRRRNLE